MIKNIKKNRSGFSLIELAVVIIIIGILTAAVIKGQKVIKNSKLTAARAATNSSAVHSIEGLKLWLEATLQDSYLDTEGPAGDDGSVVTKWLEINSQTTNKESLNATGAPTFDEDGINGRPAIDFGGGSKSFASVNFPNINEEATFFLVIKTSSADQQILGKSPSTPDATTNIMLGVNVPAKDLFWCFSNVCSTATQDNISSDKEHIVSYVYKKDYSGTTDRVSIYVDSYSVSQNLDSTVDKGQNTSNLTIGVGPTASFTGKIGELIIFDKKLNSDDHKAVMKYLGKKWGIKVAE